MTAYDDMPLDDLIKLYCSIISDFMLDSARLEMHEAICKRLGVDHLKFRPMDDFYSGAYVDPRVAEAHLRKAIAKLRKKK